MLGTNPGFSAGAAGALNCWAISTALLSPFFGGRFRGNDFIWSGLAFNSGVHCAVENNFECLMFLHEYCNTVFAMQRIGPRALRVPSDVVTWSDSHHIFHGNYQRDNRIGRKEWLGEGREVPRRSLLWSPLSCLVLMSVQSGHSSSIWDRSLICPRLSSLNFPGCPCHRGCKQER